MTTNLCGEIDATFSKAVNRNEFFKEDEGKKIKYFEKREHPPLGEPGKSCSTNLFFGFFFDGTKNNYELAEAGKNHSNVARLYDCYPGMSVPKVLPESTDWPQNLQSKYNNFFKIYVPGVASPFKEVKDSGSDWDETTGAAAGRMGEQRLIWSLAQALNNVHRYFLKAPLIAQAEIEDMLARISLNKRARASMIGNRSISGAEPNKSEIAHGQDGTARVYFEYLLRKLHKAISLHLPDKRTGRPAKIDPAIVKTIYVSIFGFSRGATQARAFTNWLQSLCKLDAQIQGTGNEMSLGGFSVQFDFLGVFDTVASVGLGNTLGMFNGHGAWADSEDSLRIPPGIKCLHLIAAHEIRRSFPVDSISVRGSLPEGCHEIVVPGAHSDIGCGYCPTEQGRGTDPNGDDMLARIPLLVMYKAARLSGVPLKLELANQPAKERFALKPQTIAAFNAYIATCREKQGPLHRIMREQARKYIEWRVCRRVNGKSPMHTTESFRRASTFDQNDLQSACHEFEEEITKFTTWIKNKGTTFKPCVQKLGFGNAHESEWEEIATWWDQHVQPCAATLHFFDNYVHDSRAWFKLFPGNPDSEEKSIEQLDRWLGLRKLGQANLRSPMLAGKADYRTVPDRLSPAQRAAADEYAKNGKIPRMATAGREPWASSFGWLAGAGYLRYRKIYGGEDSYLLS